MPSLTDLEARAADLDRCPAWGALADEAGAIRSVPLAALLDEPGRYTECSREAAGVLLDYSRQHIRAGTLDLLLQLAAERELEAWIGHLFAGEPVNGTEGRAALHVALRGGEDAAFQVQGEPVMDEVVAERQRVVALAEQVRSGQFRGHTGAPISDVVNIGIGGSDLGLVMVTEALRPYCAASLRLHFVSNVDGSHLADLLDRLDPATTLFVICSKSFATLETRLNAEAARGWIVDRLGTEAVSRHFVAVSVNAEAMDAFGIDPEQRYRLWDWVGGRYSLWSSIGLAIAIGIGPEHFGELLAGAEAMDRHFRAAPRGGRRSRPGTGHLAQTLCAGCDDSGL